MIDLKSTLKVYMFVAFELDCEEITLDIVHRERKMEEKKGNVEFRKRWPNIHLIGNPEVPNR